MYLRERLLYPSYRIRRFWRKSIDQFFEEHVIRRTLSQSETSMSPCIFPSLYTLSCWITVLCSKMFHLVPKGVDRRKYYMWCIRASSFLSHTIDLSHASNSQGKPHWTHTNSDIYWFQSLAKDNGIIRFLV